MRIGLYTLFLFPGQIGGIETYVRQLAHTLGQVDQANQYYLFISQHNRALFEGLNYPNFKLVDIPLLPVTNPILVRLLRRLKLRPAYLTEQLQRYPVEVMHYPGTTIDQLDLNLPCVLTVQDIQHEYFPQFFSPEVLAWRQANFKPSALKARHIITASEYTRRTVIEKYGLSPQKITAIRYGIGSQFTTPVSAERVEQIRQKYHLPPQFIYYPANFWAHKNHPRLFEALVRLKEHYGLTGQLVLSGIFQGQADLSALITRMGLTDQVQVLGYLPAQDLPALYTAATALVFPSLFEGFGLPVLEAMACGCPVICANTTSLPELAGEAALLVNPLDVAQMAESIYNVLNQPSLRHTLQTKGWQQAQAFSWTHTAQETARIYRDFGLNPE